MSIFRPALATAAVVVVIATATVVSANGISHPADVGTTAWRADPPRSYSGPADTHEAGDLFMSINRLRAANGLPALVWDEAIEAAAHDQSTYLASIGRLTHDGPDGDTAGDRLHAHGFTWYSWGENIASGYASAQAVLDGWVDSPTHHEILVGEWRYAAVSVVGNAAGTPFWTLVVAN